MNTSTKLKSILVAGCIILFFFLGSTKAFSQENPDKMEWFKDAKLGIFIHWGIYSVNGIDESWSFFNDYISYEDYMKQLDGFTASKYDPEKWAKLIKQSGAKYAVLTAKHHDGVALWDTKESDLSVVKKTPAGKDLVGPLMNALEKEGIKKESISQFWIGLIRITIEIPEKPIAIKTIRRGSGNSLISTLLS